MRPIAPKRHPAKATTPATRPSAPKAKSRSARSAAAPARPSGASTATPATGSRRAAQGALIAVGAAAVYASRNIDRVALLMQPVDVAGYPAYAQGQARIDAIAGMAQVTPPKLVLHRSPALLGEASYRAQGHVIILHVDALAQIGTPLSDAMLAHEMGHACQAASTPCKGPAGTTFAPVTVWNRHESEYQADWYSAYLFDSDSMAAYLGCAGPVPPTPEHPPAGVMHPSLYDRCANLAATQGQGFSFPPTRPAPAQIYDNFRTGAGPLRLLIGLSSLALMVRRKLHPHHPAA